MTETEARQYCIDMGRNPDREMIGPSGPFKEWEVYRLAGTVVEVAALVNELNAHPDETQD